MKNKKLIVVILAIVILLVISSSKILETYKIIKINSYISKIRKDYSKEDYIIDKLESFEEDKNQKVSDRATEVLGIVEKLIEDNSAYEYAVLRVKEGVSNNVVKNTLLNLLKSIDENSEHYSSAQEMINTIEVTKKDETDKNSDSNENNKSEISIEYYTKHYTAGNEKLNIKVKNTSGKDIRYLALDILEVDKSGNVVNSDWTNTSALIVNGGEISLDTYFNYQRSDSSLEFRIRDIRYK